MYKDEEVEMEKLEERDEVKIDFPGSAEGFSWLEKVTQTSKMFTRAFLSRLSTRQNHQLPTNTSHS
jgi:hypothetical protein